MIVIVVGGAQCVWDDLANAEAKFSGTEIKYFMTNSMIACLNRPGVAVTLHPHLLINWMKLRRLNRLPEPDVIFAQRNYGCAPGNFEVFRLTWRGSVSLFAVEIAHKYFGYNHILLCGCPMTIEGGHFERNKPWGEAIRFRKGWIENKESIAPYVRSLSGWTAEQFGTEF